LFTRRNGFLGVARSDGLNGLVRNGFLGVARSDGLNGLVRNGFLVGNGLLGIRDHGGWARRKVCDIRDNFGGNGGLGISLDRRALCVLIPDGVGIH